MGALEVGQNDIHQVLVKGLQDKDVEMLAPGLDGYDGSIKRWSDAAERRAAAVVFPSSTNEVSAIVKLLRSNDIDFVICCGGHATSGASSIEDGVVIDLRKMRSVTINAEKQTITAQGGCLWSDVDVAAAKYGLATPGGTVNHTGIGGLILGGGFGWLSARHGLVVDNLLSAELVLADGSVVHASETENKDLFWAIRGCGASFAICTEFTLKAYEQTKPVWGGMFMYTLDKLPDLVKFANKHHEVAREDENFIFGVGTMPGSHQVMAMVVAFYNGSEVAATQYFADLINLGPVINQTGMMPYEKANGMLNHAAQHGGRKTQAGTSAKFPMDPAFMEEISGKIADFLEKEGQNYSMVMIGFMMLPYQKARLESMAYPNRGEYYNADVTLTWTNPEQDAAGRAWARETAKFLYETGGAATDKGVGGYSNISENNNNPKKMFGVNTERLLQLKKVYDPTNQFCRWHNLMPSQK